MTSNYSRWRVIEDKRRSRKAAGLIILSGIVLGLAIFVGQKVLTGLFLFISSVKNSGQTSVKEDFIPPGPPLIYLPYEATNSATISISGYAEPGVTVFMTLNSGPIKNIVAADDGSFLIADVPLKDGDNNFTAVAVDAAGNKSQPADVRTVYYSNKPPKLEINSPNKGQNFAGSNNRIEVKGLTDPQAKIMINDRQAIVGGSGNFSYWMGLNSGENKITVLAIDEAGNEQQQELTINYSP